MAKSKAIDDTVTVVPFEDLPRRQFVHYDNSGSIVDCSNLPSKTKQADKDSCDINLIVERAAAGQFIDHVSARPGEWGVDVSGVRDYKSALDFVREADSQFMELPAKIRDRFHNDPGQFLAFVDDPANLEEGRKLGIFEPEGAPATPPAKQAEPPSGGVAVASQEATKGKGA